MIADRLCVPFSRPSVRPSVDSSVCQLHSLWLKMVIKILSQQQQLGARGGKGTLRRELETVGRALEKEEWEFGEENFP